MGELISFIFYSAISAIVFLTIYSMWFNPGAITQFVDTTGEAVSNVLSKIKQVESSNPAEDSPDIVSKCKAQYKEYAESSEREKGIDHDLIMIQQIHNEEEAKNFEDLYRVLFPHFVTPYKLSKEIRSYPAVAVATSMTSSNDLLETTISTILVCDGDGELTESAKRYLIG